MVLSPVCTYAFVHNTAPGLGVVNNGKCIGRGVLLDPRDQIDVAQPVCHLRYPPRAVIVEPLHATVSDTAWQQLASIYPALPRKCMPVAAASTDAFKVVLPEPLYGKYSISVERYGAPVHDGYVITDFCTRPEFQGYVLACTLVTAPKPGWPEAPVRVCGVVQMADVGQCQACVPIVASTCCR